MGYHYLNPDNLGSTEPGKPAAVLYAPDGEGGRKLVALEYIVPDRDQDPATVENIYAFGQRLRGPITNIPQLGVHYALHVWLWEHNPNGLFADWNPRVHCPADRETDAAPDAGEQDLRGLLGAFMFTGPQLEQPAGTLSGGEKTRLALAGLVSSAANVHWTRVPFPAGASRHSSTRVRAPGTLVTSTR